MTIISSIFLISVLLISAVLSVVLAFCEVMTLIKNSLATPKNVSLQILFMLASFVALFAIYEYVNIFYDIWWRKIFATILCLFLYYIYFYGSLLRMVDEYVYHVNYDLAVGRK